MHFERMRFEMVHDEKVHVDLVRFEMMHLMNLESVFDPL